MPVNNSVIVLGEKQRDSAIYVCMCVLSHVRLFAAPWTVAFPTQGLNLRLLHCGWVLYRQATREASQPYIYMCPVSPKIPSLPAYHLTLDSFLCCIVGSCWLLILNITVYMTIPSSPTIPFPCKCLGFWNQVLRTASLQAVSHRQSLPGFISILFLLKSCLWFLTAKCSCPLPVWCCGIPINFCSNKPLNFLIQLSLCFKM